MKKSERLACLCVVFLFTVVLAVQGCGDGDHPEKVTEVTVTQHAIVTSDNVTLALFHYAPSQGPVGRRPVLLCPGILENRYAFDLTPGSSLARYLAGRGIDSWTIEYRGRGLSGVPEGTTEKSAPWSIDDFGYLDVGAAVREVKKNAASGGELFLLGYSEGAAATTAHLLEGERGSICGQILLGPALVVGATNEVPGEEWPMLQNLCNSLASLEPIIRPNLLLPIPKMVQPIYQFFLDLDRESQLLEWGIWDLLWNRNNMTNTLAREAVFDLVSAISGNELKQYLRGANYFHRTGVCTFEGSLLEEKAGPFCYLERLPEIKVPTLVLAGSLDQLVPPVNARYIFDQLGSEDKGFRVFGLAQGDHVEYGHVDLSMGVHASEDVYPVIAGWLLERM